MTTALQSQTLNIAGTGFYPDGSAQIVITNSAGVASTFTTTATSSGAIAFAIQLATITGIMTSTSLAMYAEDMTTTDKSNTVTIQMNNIVVNPVIVAPTTPIQILTY